MNKRVKLSQIRVGQLVEVVEEDVGEGPGDFKAVTTTTWTGRVKAVDAISEFLTLENSMPGGLVLWTDDATSIYLLEDVKYSMRPGYYRYLHANQGIAAIVHFDGTGFGHSDRSTHKTDTEYFGFDPKRCDTLFERIIQAD